MKLATLALVPLLALLTGCMEDGATGPQGPAGDPGESYLSTTNPATGEITTIAIQTGDNSPVNINLNTGDDGSAGNRRPAAPAAEPTPEEDAP